MGGPKRGGYLPKPEGSASRPKRLEDLATSHSLHTAESRRESLPYWTPQSLYPLSRDPLKCGFSGQGLGRVPSTLGSFTVSRMSGRRETSS